MVVRHDNGVWSNPIFVNLTGGSFGFQVGVQSADVVLVFTSRQSIEGIVGGKITLGADAAVAAGPVGRQSSAATDIGLTAQVYSYSRASGLFAGVALDGSAMTIDDSSNEALYGRDGIWRVTSSARIHRLHRPLPQISPPQCSALPRERRSGCLTLPLDANASASTQPLPQPASEGSLTTYPMEDATPGAEPPQ